MGKLRPDYVKQGTLAVGQTSLSIPINNNLGQQVWVIEQIAVRYSVNTDAPQVTLIKNGNVFAGAAQMLRGNNGLAQTFAGQPWLYMESDDTVSVNIDNGTAGALVTVQFTYRVIGYDDDELTGRL